MWLNIRQCPVAAATIHATRESRRSKIQHHERDDDCVDRIAEQC
jgi:hypothetical protein